MPENILIEKNKCWNDDNLPFFTIITPLYNRRNTIERTMISVEKQTYRNFEYIVIDDGSTDSGDEIVREFMAKSDFPIMLVKKENGGVHTARNVGFQLARGELIVNIDSDDELLPNACETFLSAWKSIPIEDRIKYWQIKARCVSPEGKVCSPEFPENINQLPEDESRQLFQSITGEQIGCRVSNIMKNNLFPTPKQVKFVQEGVVWRKLEEKYRTWCINDIVRVYYVDGNDRLTGTVKKSEQSCMNAMWNSMFFLNNSKLYISDFKNYCSTIFRFCLMRSILKCNHQDFIQLYKLTHRKDRFVQALLKPIAAVGACVYIRKRIEV